MKHVRALTSSALFAVASLAATAAAADDWSFARLARVRAADGTPTTFDAPVVVVLVDYADAQFPPPAPGDAATSRWSERMHGARGLAPRLEALTGGTVRLPRGGVVGPVRYPDDPTTGKTNESNSACDAEVRKKPLNCLQTTRTPAKLTELALRAAAAQIRFEAFDRDKNGVVDDQELTLVVVAPSGNGGRARSSGCPLVGKVKVCVNAVQVGDGATDETILHEIAHTKGAFDLYGPWSPYASVNSGYTVMATTGPGAPSTMDAFHRLHLGWASARTLTRGGPSGCFVVEDTSQGSDRGRPDQRPIVVADASRRDEYFAIEVQNGGVVVWYVKLRADGHPERAPYMVQRDVDGAALSATASGDDVAVDTTRDMQNDVILWGPNHRLETTPSGKDTVADTGLVLAAAPGRVRIQKGLTQVRGTTRFGVPARLTEADGAVRLVTPDGVDWAATLQVGRANAPRRGVRPVLVRTSAGEITDPSMVACRELVAPLVITQPAADLVGMPRCMETTESGGVLRWRSATGQVMFASPVTQPTTIRSSGRVLWGTGMKATPASPVTLSVGAASAFAGILVDPDGPNPSATAELEAEVRVEHGAAGALPPRTDVLRGRVRVINTTKTAERCGASAFGDAAVAGALSTILPLAAGAFKPAPLDPSLLGPLVPPPPPVVKP